MSTYEYDPITGLPKQKAVGPGLPVVFGAATGTTPTGGTGYGGTGVAGAPTGPANAQQYRDILLNDPIYKQIISDLSAQGISDEAGAKAIAQRAFINFGEVPTTLDPAYANWIDPTTRELAARNTEAGFSQAARLAKVQRDNIRAIRNVLASRGMLRSGELGYQLGEEQQRYGTAQYDAREQLTSGLASIQGALAAGRRAAQLAAAQALQGAAGRAPGYGNPPSQGQPPQQQPPTQPTQPTTQSDVPLPMAPPPWVQVFPNPNPFAEPERRGGRPPNVAY